jgi:hypothetical protein
VDSERAADQGLAPRFSCCKFAAPLATDQPRRVNEAPVALGKAEIKRWIKLKAKSRCGDEFQIPIGAIVFRIPIRLTSAFA